MTSVIAGWRDPSGRTVAGRWRLAGLASLATTPGNQPAVAELGVLVADAWQRRGIGAAMVDMLLVRARERGVQRVSACVSPGRSGLLAALAGRVEPENSSRTPDGLTSVHTLAPGRPGEGRSHVRRSGGGRP